MSSQIVPAWGDSALDQFLLKKWNYQSVSTAEDQRTSIIRDYVSQGWQQRKIFTELAKSQAIIPSEAQIREILRPVRPLRLRQLAHDLGNPSAIWLRTFYGPGSDNQHKVLVNTFDLEDAIGSKDKMLNLAARYDFGDHWQKIFDLMPELVDPGIRTPATDAEMHSLNLQVTSGQMDVLARTVTQHIKDSDENDQAIFKFVNGSLQKAAVTNYIVVEDEEALRSGLVLFLFIDECGRIVRHLRTDRSTIGLMVGAWPDEIWDETDPWMSAEVGEDYLEGAACCPSRIAS